jgi:hypothetical protein
VAADTVARQAAEAMAGLVMGRAAKVADVIERGSPAAA